ncbi:TolC family protein [Candidatus Methylacidithermus pantelleriae]|uniref:Outer membrane protein n=1 Tax=Candidatus Methylacidithermus pantelleriae TaxID=2744239 RepID=A0A8J2FS24_9BACT|nr:TolC family protein [Candidatus Methylacidithermus pantelleriae]CAF0695900.1 Outer membrane protein [Candidatus Methylacidithermus pantelleriae]
MKSRGTLRNSLCSVGIGTTLLVFSLTSWGEVSPPSQEPLEHSLTRPPQGSQDAPVPPVPSAASPERVPPARPAPKNLPEVEEILAQMGPILGKPKEPHALDLERCFELAAIRSDQLKIDAQTVAAQQAIVAQTIATLFPSVQFVNQQNFRDFAGFGSFIGGTFVGGGRRYTSFNALTGSQLLFNGLATQNQIAAARAQAAASQFSLKRDYQLLYGNVAAAFYNALSFEGGLFILEDEAKALEALIGELEYRVSIGRSRPADLLLSKTNLANVRAQQEQTRGALSQQLQALAFYTGIPKEKLRLKETHPFPSPDVLERYLAQVGARPDILASVENLRAAERTLSATKGSLWPTVTAQGNFFLTQDPPSPGQWFVSLSASLPIFDGGLISARIQQQRAVVQQAQLQIEQLRRTADQQVRTAFDLLNSQIAQVLRFQEMARVAGLSYGAQLEDYRRGVVDLLTVLTALQQFHAARLQLHQAEMSARFQLINLFVTAGLTPDSTPRFLSLPR